jgi:signal transduction histidine kinase/AmiR/NasT family two-component response regulator
VKAPPCPAEKRLVHALAAGLAIVALFYMVDDARSGFSYFSLAMLGVLGLSVVLWHMVRQERPLAAIGHTATFGMFLAATFVSLHTGGSEATSIAWYAMLPLSAALLCGARASMGWAAISLTSLLILGQLANLGIAIPDALPPRSRALYTMFENLLLLVGVAALMNGFLTQSARDKNHLREHVDQLAQEREARAKAERRVHETLQIQNQILAKVGSEMRVPLTGIQGMSRMLSSTELDQAQKDYTDAIQSSGRALMELVEDVLDFSRLESGELEFTLKPFDIEVAVAGVTKHLCGAAEGNGNEILLRFAPDTPRFFTGDAGRIQQVLGSLVKNAINHTPHGGHILIDVEETDSTVDDSTMRFHVRDWNQDSNLAQRSESIENANRPLSAAEHDNGSGFGLALSQRILSLMGGELGFEQSEDGGNDLWFSLKLPRSREPKVNNLFSGNLAGLKALVVEDNECNRDVLAEQLMEWGLKPIFATSGQDALRMMRVDLDDSCPYDLAIIDHQLPDMDGKRLGMMMQSDEILAACRMVLLTAEAGAGRGREYRQAGFAAYLAKPVTPSILRDTLAMAWGLGREEESKAKAH